MEGKVEVKGNYITEESIEEFERVLYEGEKSEATIEKYVAAMKKWGEWLKGKEVTHEEVMRGRERLKEGHAVSTVNGYLSAMNAYLDMVNMKECKVKLLRVQRRVFREEERELKKSEYVRLIETAKRLNKTRLMLIMETICATGIRVSETEYITVEAVEKGYAEVTLKGKTRTIFIPKKLSNKLRKYAKKEKIKEGKVFLTGRGKAVSRKQIWAEMKGLCKVAGVMATRVFPHNLRHLFARCYYRETHDVVMLADMLGHSSVETTRIYLVTTGVEHARALENLRLVC